MIISILIARYNGTARSDIRDVDGVREKETYIRHQSLETHVFDTGNVLCPLEVFARSIFASFPSVVYEVLGHFTKSSTFFTEIDDNTATTFLCFFDSLFYAEDEVRTAGADVGAEDVTAVTFIVNTERKTDVGIGHFCRITEDVDSQTTDGREEKLDVASSDEFGVGTTGFFK